MRIPIRIERFFAVVGIVAVAAALIGAGAGVTHVIDLKDTNEKVRLKMGISNAKCQSAALWFYDSGGKRRLYMGLNENDDPMICLYNTDGAMMWCLSRDGLRKDAPGKKSKIVIDWPKNMNQKVWVNKV